ncbi:MAG: DMT family transporter [Proteobacteria bacterium]|nr:DMT family transporter [Pseudomonadota bacterium]
MTRLDIVLYVCTVLIWGSSWIATHYQAASIAPEVSIVWRYGFATPLMFAVAAYRGERLGYRLADHGYFVALGLCIFSINYMLFYHAAQHVSSGLLSIEFTLAAVGNVLLSAVVFGTRIERRAILGGVIGIAGVAAMFYPQIKGLRLDGGALLGFVLGLVATACFCVGNMVSLAAKRRKLPVFASLSWAMLYGTVFVALVAIAKGEAFVMDWSPIYLGSLIYLVLLASVVGFGTYFTLLNRIGAARAGYSTVLYPVVALAASTWLEDYRWTPLAVVGLAAVLFGVMLVLRQPKA